MSKYQRHIFVCQSQRPAGGKPACGPRGGQELLLRLQEGLADHPELWDEVTVTPSGCLGLCFEGPAAVVYPEGTWYAGLQPDDAAELVEAHLVEGRPVERRTYRWPAR